jgi:hypothetical protein
MIVRLSFPNLLAFVAATALLPGCLRTQVDRRPLQAVAEPRDARVAQAAPPARISPYHPQTPWLGGMRDRLPDPGVERVAYPQAPAEPERVPAPAVLPDSPPVRVSASPAVRRTEPAAEEPLVAALRCLLDKRPEEAVEILKRYDRPNQDMLLGLMALTVRLTRGSLDQASPQEVSNVLEQLNSLALTLRTRAPLTIEKMLFCSEVSRFGVYQPLAGEPMFWAGREGQPGEQIQLYVELQNFTSQPQGASYETKLASRLEIRDLQGKTVWLRDFPAQQPDRSHTRRHDYFITYRFPVPRDVLPARYTLCLEVRDVTAQPNTDTPAHRVARRSLNFEVIPFGALRPGRTTSTSARPGGE